MKLAEWQKVWIQSENVSCIASQYVTIDKVGKKYATVKERQNLKINIKTMRVFSGEYHCGKVWVSKDAYEKYLSKQDAWKRLREEIQFMYEPPQELTQDGLRYIKQLLKIKENLVERPRDAIGSETCVYFKNDIASKKENSHE